MATKEKAVNFTDAQFSALKAAYLNPALIGYDDRKAAIEKVAKEIGKTSRSCIAKLSREKVYIKKEYTTKNGEKPQDKNALVSIIAGFLGVPVEFAGSLEKANKAVLEKIADALQADFAEPEPD